MVDIKRLHRKIKHQEIEKRIAKWKEEQKLKKNESSGSGDTKPK
tara:strand:+ start:394 stop:525 length:132 start_codon:yes stop_codon:yes gene_type:complete